MANNNYIIIKKKINQFIKKYYLNELIKGIIWFVFYTFIFVLSFALLEYYLWLSPNIRKILFYTSVFVFIVLFSVFILVQLLNILGLKKSLNDDKAATIIGKHFPEIKDKLLNLLQLKHQNNQSELLLASIDQKAEQLKPFKFSGAVDFKRNIKFLPFLLLPFLVVISLKLLNFDSALTQSYSRIISYNKQYEPPLPYSVNFISPTDFIYGHDYNLKIKITGNEIPEQIFLERNNQQIPLQKINDSIFGFTFNSVKNNLQINIITDEHRFGPYQISMIYSPVILSNKISLFYPSYLHLKNKQYAHKTNFTVPAGTIIKWNINTQHTDSLHFSINNKKTNTIKNSNTYTIKHQAFESFDYSIRPINKYFADNQALSYHIDVIPDQFPELKVSVYKDTINAFNFHKISGSDDYGLSSLVLYYKKNGEIKEHKIRIPLHNTSIIQTNFVFPDTISIDKGKMYSYYFRLFDNDKIKHFKSVKSQMFYYNKLSDKDLKKLLLEQQKQDLQDLSRLQNKFNKNKNDLNKIKEQFTQQKNLDWKSKKLLEQQIKEQEKQEEFFKRSIEKFKSVLDKLPDDKKNQTKEDLKKRLEELKQLDKKKKLLDELKKLAEKLKKEDLVKKLKDLQNYSEHQEKSLERILELTKKYYMQQKMAQIANKLDSLSQKQQKLANINSDTKKQQDSLKNEMEKMQKQMDSLQKMNKSLKKPMKMPDAGTDMEEIKQDMQKASDDLQNQDSQNANQKQQKAANKMKKLSKSMQMSMQGGGGEQKEEDIKTLQALLKSLLNFSFKQEDLLNNYNDLQDHKSLSMHLLSQNRQKKYFTHINDSLYTLALRNPKISELILETAYTIDNELDKTLESLSESKPYFSLQHAQYVLTGANTLADMLSNALDNMKNSMSMQGQGQGKKKGKSFSLPDIIKKQGESVKQMQDAMKNKQGKDGKKGKGKKDNKGDKNGKQGNKEDESARQYKLYQQQQRIKEDLEQLSDKFKDPSSKERISKLIKKMEDLEKRLLKEGITQSTLQKMIELQHELLKLKNASFTQHEDNKRRSKTNYNQFNIPDSLFFDKNTKFAPVDELLKRNKIPVNQQVKKKIKDFIRND